MSRALEALAAATGLVGAYLLADRSALAAWGWVGFMISNFAWIAIAVQGRLWFLLLMQLGFTYTSALGIQRWLLV